MSSDAKRGQAVVARPAGGTAAYVPGAAVEREFFMDCMEALSAAVRARPLEKAQMQALLDLFRADGWTQVQLKEACHWCARNVGGFPYYSDFWRWRVIEGLAPDDGGRYGRG